MNSQPNTFLNQNGILRPNTFLNRSLATCLPRQDHVWITTEQLVRFHKHFIEVVFFFKNDFDEMLYKLNSAKYARAFQQNPILP